MSVCLTKSLLLSPEAVLFSLVENTKFTNSPFPRPIHTIHSRAYAHCIARPRFTPCARLQIRACTTRHCERSVQTSA